MDTAEFWKIIDDSVVSAGNYEDAQYAFLHKRLLTLIPEEIVAFEREYDMRRNEAYKWDLWGAAYEINGGCSDDGFEYFRAWLISRGRAVFEAALINPDSLAAHVKADEDNYEFEAFLYLSRRVYKEITGKEPDYENGVEFKKEPDGQEWDFEDDTELSTRFPMLYRLKREL